MLQVTVTLAGFKVVAELRLDRRGLFVGFSHSDHLSEKKSQKRNTTL